MLKNISRLLSTTQPKNTQTETLGNVILSTVLYGSKTWSLTLRQGNILSIQEQGAEEYIWEKKTGN
jgi:hypothetical protein